MNTPRVVLIWQLDSGSHAVDCNILQVLESLGGFKEDYGAAILPRKASLHQSRTILYKGSHGVVVRLKTILSRDSE